MRPLFHRFNAAGGLSLFILALLAAASSASAQCPPLYAQYFDVVTPPHLPGGWSASQGINVTGAPFWVTSRFRPDTPPNDAFSTAPDNILDNRLDTPVIVVHQMFEYELNFRHSYNLENGFDGAVLEISTPNINGGAFTDVTDPAIGGAFAGQGYNGTISTAFQSPIAGRMAFTGNSKGYVSTTLYLGFVNMTYVSNVILRFRLVTDNSVASTGWQIDSFFWHHDECNPPPPTPSVPPTPTPTPTPAPTVTPPPAACYLTEAFDDNTTLTPSGWFTQNNTQPSGSTGWFQGNSTVFRSQSGASNSYIAVNYQNGVGLTTISNWLLTPPLILQNDGSLSFWTRTTNGMFSDRLQIRMSTNGASRDVGSTATSVGDFTTLLLDINPTYISSGYPLVWSQFTVPLSGLSGPITGRLAFRYFVENGGPNGTHSDYVGIDTVQYACDAATPSPTPTATPTTTATATATATASPTATITLTPTPTPGPTSAARLLNLSTRLHVQTGGNIGIGGFIITGNDPKQVLVRGIGPSLTAFGVADALLDPTLELRDRLGALITSNDNWRNTQEPAITATGLAPTNDLESAILATVEPGSYTALLSGKNNTTGIGLVEIYDLGPATSNLANISSRADVGTGDKVAIAGFILDGGATSHLLFRGIGPSLAGCDCSVLADPTIELRNSSGVVLASNDNCPSGFPLPPFNPLESCIDATLPAGPYTIILAGKNNGTGVGLVEIYNVTTN